VHRQTAAADSTREDAIAATKPADRINRSTDPPINGKRRSSMSNYSPVGVVARRLGIAEPAVQEMLDLGWLKTEKKNGISFLDGHQEYRARFILALRAKKTLDNSQISFILAEQEPPYSFQQVDAILARMAALTPA